MEQILIVEDDSFLNKMVAYNLTADGYDVTSALNARTAAEAIRQREFDLVLLDINLPDGNGFELCKLIKPQHPVMEGKCVLFKEFGNVDAFPLCIKSKDVDEIVNTIYMISGSFAGVNLEDISAPRCFEIERKLKEKCDIPIFHDDQHGTAIITLAGLTNALKVVGKKKEDVRVVINGAGAAAISITKLLLTAGYKDITLCDRNGAIYEGREQGMNPVKEEMAKVTNLARKQGRLAEMLVGADVFIGVSAPKMVTAEMVKTMNKDAVIFACANPTPARP